MTDNARLLRRQEALVRLAYPRRYRAVRGPELLGHLAESAAPRQTRPSAGDVADLFRHGLRVRARLTHQEPAGRALGLAAPYGLALAAGLSVIAICYGEWPGVRASAPNGQLAYHQYGLGPFETSGVIVYALVLLAFASLLLGAARLARWSAGLGVLAAAATHVVSVRGGTAAANLTFLVVLALCLVPQAMASVGYRRARVRPSAGPVLVCLGLTLLGPVLFSTSRWSGGWADDRREAFYRSGSGFVLLATPAIPVVAGLVLVAAAAVALRRQRLEIWTAASLVLVPAAAWTFGGGRIASHTPDAYVYQGSFGAFLTICTMTAVVAVLHLALGRPVRSSDPELGRP